MADGSITSAKLSETILKYLKPEITSQPQGQTILVDGNATLSVAARGKYLTYQWKRNGTDLPGETNATLTITDANATLHDGNYTVTVSNDFGSQASAVAAFWVIDLTQGLVAYYPFDGNASDVSGNGHHGIVNGATLGEDRRGVASKAYSFDGTNDSITVPVNMTTLRNLNDPVTFTLWFKPTQQLSRNALMLGANPGAGPDFSFSIGSDRVVRGGLYGVPVGTSITPVSLGDWHFIGVSRREEQSVLFLDRTVQTIATPTGTHNRETNLILGARQFSPQVHFPGYIDEFRVYDRGFSESDFLALYNYEQ